SSEARLAAELSSRSGRTAWQSAVERRFRVPACGRPSHFRRNRVPCRLSRCFFSRSVPLWSFGSRVGLVCCTSTNGDANSHLQSAARHFVGASRLALLPDFHAVSIGILDNCEASPRRVPGSRNLDTLLRQRRQRLVQ